MMVWPRNAARMRKITSGRIVFAMRTSESRRGTGCVERAGSEDSDGESFIAWDSLSFMMERRIDPLREPRWQ